ncbi:hypothetical protein [Falsiroseomonas sp.]|uniref:hypothetical protein n=1 Tax=Falsiroseomonas sp. TaxID=2870721 RepID=UPI0035639968
MSDIDRVFARLGGRQTAGSDQRELRNIPRKGASAGSRTVEVVRLPARGAAASEDSPRRTDHRVRAATWDDGFPAKSTPPPSSAPLPVAAEAPEPVAHVMPTWTPAVAEPSVEPAPVAPSEAAQPALESAKQARRTAQGKARRVADPFDASDDGANCLRCGYLIEPARERRGLVTCAECG